MHALPGHHGYYTSGSLLDILIKDLHLLQIEYYLSTLALSVASREFFRIHCQCD